MSDPPRRPVVVPGIPGAKLPPPRPRQKTIPDGAPPPSRQDDRSEASEPRPDPRIVLPSEPPERRREPRSMSPAPWDPRASSPELAQAVRDMGDELKPAPVSTPIPRPGRPILPEAAYRVDQPWWRTARGMAIVLPIIVTSVTGVLGGLTAAVVVPIIRAVREPLEGAKVKDIAEAKAAGERCDAAVVSERKSALAREQALADKIVALDKRTDEIAKRVPEVKPDPSRPPAPK